MGISSDRNLTNTIPFFAAILILNIYSTFVLAYNLLCFLYLISQTDYMHFMPETLSHISLVSFISMYTIYA
jgi:hypothetical protein